jgi:ATP-dependent DNA ligase
VLLPVFQPLALGRKPEPFSHADWLFEIKWDGFRSFARIDHGRCKLISRKGNEFKSYKSLSACFAVALQIESAILDGEIVAENIEPHSPNANQKFYTWHAVLRTARPSEQPTEKTP